jgi:CBS-domain-containing membrane protein
MTEEAAGSDAITEEEPSPLQQYLRKFAGAGVKGPAPPPLSQSAFSFLGSFAGLATLGLLQEYLLPALAPVHLALVIGSFGAMAVLIYSQPQAPASQPKNCLLGNPLGGVVGIIVVKAMEVTGLQEWLWLSAALAVSLTIFAQELTATVSPPGGATALIFVLRAYGAPSGPLPHDVVLYEMGHWYVLCPAFLGSLVLVAVGLVTNNLSAVRSYPQGWW